MQGRSLIVTGATGIGAAVARFASARGARILLATGEEQPGWELAAETGAECRVGDLNRPAAASILSQCLARYGRVDALFNVAGLSGKRFGDGPVHECSDEGWELTLAYNLRVTVAMCRAAVGRMLQQVPGEGGARGAILNVGSVLAGSPEPRHFAMHAYAAAKGAVESMTRSMAAWCAPHGIRVNAIAPGLVRTPASERASNPELAEFLRRKQPLAGGMLDAGDVARAALFLLSGESSAITGQVLTVDGGWSVTGA
jgi:NAD(P)-dependent dehydrogenase (short-subunit alcohol dehydrogenase family)